MRLCLQRLDLERMCRTLLSVINSVITTIEVQCHLPFQPQTLMVTDALTRYRLINLIAIADLPALLSMSIAGTGIIMATQAQHIHSADLLEVLLEQ